MISIMRAVLAHSMGSGHPSAGLSQRIAAKACEYSFHHQRVAEVTPPGSARHGPIQG